MSPQEFTEQCWANFRVDAGGETPPRYRGTKNTWLKRFGKVAVPTIGRMARKAPFDFAIGTHSYTITGTENNLLKLTGKSSDAADVISVRYGEEEKWLDSWTRIRYQRQRDSSSSAVFAWYKPGIAGLTGGPYISLIYAGSTGTVVKYDYLKKNITVAEWPEQYIDALIFGVLLRFDPPRFRAQFKEAFADMMESYDFNNIQPQQMELHDDWQNYADIVANMLY